MARLPASSSPATLSWVRARSHRPSTARSWNRKMRSLAFDGFLRTCSCKSFKAVLGSPPRSQSSVPIPLSHARSPQHARYGQCCPTPAVFARSAALHVAGDIPADRDRGVAAAILLLRRVLDLELGEVQRDVLGDPILAAAAAGRAGR